MSKKTTMTGRMSCSQPNIEQIPRHSWTPEERAEKLEKLKSFLRAMGIEIPEFDINSIDYAALEEKVAMKLTDQEKKELRMEAKTARFLHHYGIGRFGKGPVQLISEMQVNKARAEEIKDALQEKFPAFRTGGKMTLEQMARQEESARAAGLPFGDHEVLIEADSVEEVMGSLNEPFKEKNND